MKEREFNNFDLVRLFAAANVMLLHVADHLGQDVALLRLLLDPLPGVPIFFVVSGFLISRAWERYPVVPQYVRNRVLRIYPALWVCLGVSIASVFVAGFVLAESPGKVFAWLVAQVTFGQFVTPAFLQGYGVGILNGSLWTIPVELQFYAALPLLLLWRPAVWITAAASLVAYATIRDLSVTLPGGISIPLQVTLLPNFYMFAIGILIARHNDRLMPYLSGRAHWWFCVYLLAVVGGTLFGLRVGTNHPNPLLMVVLGATVISAAYSLPSLSTRILRGHDISYGIYIYHMVVVNFLLATGMSSYTLAILLSLTLATLSWMFIERPALALKNLSLRRVLAQEGAQTDSAHTK